ncbi:D-inositol 3-phosphate glycosyltransferase [Bacillus sp. T2.9-1]|uniref:glycosyltransferase family 4 protein n=1 Tax=Bacillus sp. T2.9-1 TaxID=3041163 RepID=UPI0024779FB0|nr:glycosyltransferase family 1 protein [Bacillus sp. T2.9-1]CAI9395045.1 D-inositol 3-phosphate glycosyltransferase [Bacillus sp. T2.9-1]
MKIAINATILGEKPSGLGVYTINIIKEFVRLAKNEEIIIYTSNPEILGDLDNVKVIKTSKYLMPEYGKIAGGLRFLWSQFIMPIRSKSEKVDVLYSTTHHGMFLSNIKQILTVHDLLPIIYPKQHKLQYYYFKYILPILLKKSYKLVTVSQNTKNDLNKEYDYEKSKIFVVYNSYDKEHFKSSSDNKFKEKYGEYVLFLGASYPHKNLIRTIKAFNSSIISDKHLKLIVAGGRKDYKETVKQYFSNSEALKDVVFLDYIPYNDLPTLYSNASLFVYPSLYEGFGIPPVEAMACGCPTIVSNTSSLPEVCGSSSHYFNPENMEDISKSIEFVLTDSNVRKHLIESGYQNCERFSWKLSANEIYRIIKGDQAS